LRGFPSFRGVPERRGVSFIYGTIPSSLNPIEVEILLNKPRRFLKPTRFEKIATKSGAEITKMYRNLLSNNKN